MTEIELRMLTDVNWPIKNCAEGFEGQALLNAWTIQLTKILIKPGATCGEINSCIVRLAEIAKEVTINSQPQPDEE